MGSLYESFYTIEFYSIYTKSSFIFKYILLYFIVINQLKGNLSVMVKLLSYDFEIINLNYGNSLLKCRIRLCTIYPMWSNPSPWLRIDGSFIYRIALFIIVNQFFFGLLLFHLICVFDIVSHSLIEAFKRIFWSLCLA